VESSKMPSFGIAKVGRVMGFKLHSKACSLAALALLVLAALGPGKWVPRSGLGWQFDHVAGYLAFTWLFCFAWPRPRVVGGALAALAVLLEGLQAFTPDRHADLRAACLNAGAVLAAAWIAEYFIRSPRTRTGWAVLMAPTSRRLALDWNSARTALLAAFRRARLAAIALAQGTLPESVGLIPQPVPIRAMTGPLLRDQRDSD
jgi:VanZ family protein